MFYTGIITSLLPYLLLIGVFGTFFVNQALGRQDNQVNPPSCQKRLCKSNPGDITAPAFFLQGTPGDENHHKTADQLTGPVSQVNPFPRDIPPGPMPSAPASHLKWPGSQLAALNTTFSFRGPPSIS